MKDIIQWVSDLVLKSHGVSSNPDSATYTSCVVFPSLIFLMCKMDIITPFTQMLKACHMPGTVLDVQCTVMRETDKAPALKECVVSTSLVGRLNEIIPALSP